MYDLVGLEDRRFSPYCWRARMALAHKGLEYEARPTSFQQIKAIGDGGHGRVPVIEDGGRFVADSWEIAEYLDESYPDRPSLFGGANGRGLARFIDNWTTALMGEMIQMTLADIHENLLPEDRGYFRESREKRFGKTLEEVVEGREAHRETLAAMLAPLRRTLGRQPFIGGERPHYADADYLVFGAFQWPRVVSPFTLLGEDDSVHTWFERCLDLHGGIGRAEPAKTA